MPRRFRHVGAVAVALMAGGLNLALAGDAAVGDILIKEPWARASPVMVKAGAAYMTVENRGAKDDRLVSAAADVADTVELHTHIQDGDVMKMRAVDAIAVPAGGAAELKPGGLHVMLIGLRQPLAEGESFPLTLDFETAGTVTVDVEVRKAGAMGHGHGHGPKE